MRRSRGDRSGRGGFTEIGVTLPLVSRTLRMSLLLPLALAIALVAAACESPSGETTSTTGDDQTVTSSTQATTTTEAPLGSIPPDAIPGTTSESIAPEVAEAMRAEIGVLILDTEENRGLPFLSVPTVTILDADAFTERVRTLLEEDLDPVEVAGDQAILELFGMLDGTVDLYQLLVDLYTEQVAGFYDPDVGELVVPVSVDGITPLQKITIVHELVHALTDQHFDFNDVYEERTENGTGDDVSAILALVEGDATYQQFLYLESMDPAEAAEAVLESLAIDTSVLDSVPSWIRQDLTFPYEHGLIFNGFLVTNGGLKGIDEAYLDPPISSEQILHPEKYDRFEMPTDLAPLTVSLPDWELFDEATFGEWGIRMLLLDSLTPADVTQAAAGWGNDTYVAFLNGDDAAVAWVYEGDSVADAEDLTDGLVAHIRRTMDAGSPQESGGGLLFSGGSTYVFIDRVDEKIFFVAATDAEAGASLRDQLGV